MKTRPLFMIVVTINYIKENDMAVTTMIDLQKLKAICLEKVIEHLQEEVENDSFINAEQAEHMLDFIGSMLIDELILRKEIVEFPQIKE